MKRRGSSNGGRRNFETWIKPPQPSPAQPSPTEKQKLDVVSHSALLSSSPGTPAGPLKQPSSRRALGRGLHGAVHQQPSRKKHAKWTLPSRGQKERMQQNCLLPPSHPGLLGKEGTPQTKQPAPFQRGLYPTLTLPGGIPPSTRARASLGSSEDQLIKMRGADPEGAPLHTPPWPSQTTFTSGFFPQLLWTRRGRVASTFPCPTLGLEAPGWAGGIPWS